jgi:hypothetical protein
MDVALPGSIEPVAPSAEVMQAAEASLRDLARVRGAHGLRRASVNLELDDGECASVAFPRRSWSCSKGS